MSQYNWGTMDPYLKSGNSLVSDLNSYRTAHNSQHMGTASPSYIAAGMQWLKNTTNPWEHYYYDGVDNIRIGTVDSPSDVYQITSNSKSFIPSVVAPGATIPGDMWIQTSINALNIVGVGTFKPRSYETILKDLLTGSTSYSIVNLSSFRTLRWAYYFTTPVASQPALRTSTNNGSSYDSGASDYVSVAESLSSTAGTTIVAAETISTSYIVGNCGTLGTAAVQSSWGLFELFDWNQARVARISHTGGSYHSTQGLRVHSSQGLRNQATARDAIRLLAFGAAGVAQAMTGWIHIEGTRI